MNVHGAGAQRSDFKSGDPSNWPHGHGPQGDVVRIYYVLCVRDADLSGVNDESDLNRPDKNMLAQNYPNPFNANTVIQYYLNRPSQVTIDIYDLLGRKIETLSQGFLQAGNHRIIWESRNNPTGLYFYKIDIGEYAEIGEMILLK